MGRGEELSKGREKPSLLADALEAVIAARASATRPNITMDERMKAEAGLSGALARLMAVAEAYPDLKANQNFGQLQEELTGTEDRIAYSRQFFNDSVLRYNNKIQAFPGVILANAMGFKAREYFEADDDSREIGRAHV